MNRCVLKSIVTGGIVLVFSAAVFSGSPRRDVRPEGMNGTVPGTARAAAKTADYQALVKLHEDFRAAQRIRREGRGPGFSPAAIETRRKTLEDLRARLAEIDPRAWPIPRKVDYLLVRAELNDMDFNLRVLKPWERDPGMWVEMVAGVPYVDIPAQNPEGLRAKLLSVPKTLDQAKATLNGAAGELTALALRRLELSDGVNQGEPKRAVPPDGVIGWYKDLLASLERDQPELLPDVRSALAAVEEFRDWMKENRAALNGPTVIGVENYDWYVRNVRMIPYTAREIALLGDAEWDRTVSFLKIEEHRNRRVPPLLPAADAAEHERRVREAESLIRTFTRDNELLSFPDDIPPAFETDAYWIVRPGGKRHFWEELTYRDPLNNHIHASIPGHRYHILMDGRDRRPIRGGYGDSGRAEGWTFYIEEMYLQAGLLDGRPHARELFYLAQLWRARRVPIELRMLTEGMTVDEAIKELVGEIPYMDENLARYDLAIYLQQPTSGMIYTIGKLQIERLLADRARQLGPEFHLGRFHDDFLATGAIPIALIRWEMTGLDDEIRRLWPEGFEDAGEAPVPTKVPTIPPAVPEQRPRR